METPFGHLSVFEEFQREPDEMTLDLIQLITHILGRNELVKDMTRLDTTWREETIIVLESFDWKRESALGHE